MDDMSEKISQFLSDPKSMEQLKSLTSLLSNDQNPAPPPPKNNNPLSALGNLDVSPDLLNNIMKIAPLLSSVNKDDNSTRLLNALRPFLSEHRQSRLDESAKMLSLLKILPLLKGSGIF